jgi:hypothetical protein
MQSQKLGIITTIAALLLVISAVSTVTPESVSAYEKNQATSQTSTCGNEFIPINIGCQNTDSQIQGDENAAALTAQQTFPEVKSFSKDDKKFPQTCEECFTEFLTEAQIQNFLDVASSEDITLEEVCASIEPNKIELVGDILNLAGIDEETIQQIMECLERVLGFEPPEE